MDLCTAKAETRPTSVDCANGGGWSALSDEAFGASSTVAVGAAAAVLADHRLHQPPCFTPWPCSLSCCVSSACCSSALHCAGASGFAGPCASKDARADPAASGWSAPGASDRLLWMHPLRTLKDR